MPERGEVFMPVPDDQLGRLSLIEALRANTDAVQRLARHTEMQDRKLDQIKDAIGKLETRMTLIERDTLGNEVTEAKGKIKTLEGKVLALELDRERREARLSALDWMFKNWPGVVGFLFLFGTVLVATGKLHL